MTAPSVKPDKLAVPAEPRRVTRINKKVVVSLSALISVSLFGATWIALYPPTLRQQSGEELYSTERKPTAEGLSALPRGYGDLKPPTPPAQLGAPLPGDLGPPIVKLERDLGLRPDPEGDAERAERLRLAQKARQAQEAGVFFRLAARHEPTNATTAAMSPDLPGALPAANESSNSGNDPNGQDKKLAFLNGKAETAIYNPHALQQPLSPYQVMAGSVIAASLVTGLNSDLPGYVIAQVSENVYDTVSGRHLLIPQGTRLLGKYDSRVAYGQSRALVVWNRLILPNGSSIVIDNLPATDTAGTAGLEDEVDFHTWALVKGVALSTLLGVGTELTFGPQENPLVRALRSATQDNANRAGQSLVERTLDIQPTLTIRPGWPLRVIVHKDLVLKPYQN